jgi:hypothetical protein
MTAPATRVSQDSHRSGRLPERGDSFVIISATVALYHES